MASYTSSWRLHTRVAERLILLSSTFSSVHTCAFFMSLCIWPLMDVTQTILIYYHIYYRHLTFRSLYCDLCCVGVFACVCWCVEVCVCVCDMFFFLMWNRRPFLHSNALEVRTFSRYTHTQTVHTHTQTHIHAHIRTHTHSRTHTHTHTLSTLSLSLSLWALCPRIS